MSLRSWSHPAKGQEGQGTFRDAGRAGLVEEEGEEISDEPPSSRIGVKSKGLPERRSLGEGIRGGGRTGSVWGLSPSG